jgi:hypothetical protein
MVGKTSYRVFDLWYRNQIALLQGSKKVSMSGKLFAFNVSKKIERVDEKAGEQWVGDQTAWAMNHAYCTGLGVGLSGCFSYPNNLFCYTYGGYGNYICDSY